MSTTIGEKIKSIREAEKITQKEFCEITEFKIDTLKNYESKRREPSFQAIQKICAAFPQYTMYLMHEKMPVPAVEGQYTPEEKLQRDLNSQEKHA
ncbi:MAG: helix-turn-helix transcriptional regulator [Hydrogenovibrio crunogenus]|nr:helix-turn-helix transcriptional regulator [Hydrogenovibrio crunogenus]